RPSRRFFSSLECSAQPRRRHTLWVSLAGQGTDDTTGRFLWASILFGTVLSLGVCYGIATRTIVLGSPEGHWVYGYVQAFTPRSLIVFLLVATLSGALLAVPPSVSTRHESSLIFIGFLVALAAQGLLRSLAPFSMEKVFASDAANSFYGVSRHYGALTVLRDFDHVRSYWPLHAQSNMPGKLMIVYALKYVSRRPGVLAWLVVAASNI